MGFGNTEVQRDYLNELMEPLSNVDRAYPGPEIIVQLSPTSTNFTCHISHGDD